MPSSSGSDAAVTLEIKTEAAQAAEATPGQPPERSRQKPKYEFWLVAKIQDCKVVTAQETASAKCFLKFHWQDKDFLTKVRAEKLEPSSDGFAEIESNLKLERLAVDLAKGGMVYGMVDATADHFPLNIDAIFANQISAERFSSLGWTKYDNEKGVVSVQIVVKVTVQTPLRLERYPYDRHVVPFVLDTRASKNADGTSTRWELSKKWPDWAPDDYPEDKRLVLQSQTTPDLEYDHKQCFAYLDGKGKKPILCVLIERPPHSVMQRVALPVFIVVSIALAVSGVRKNSYGEEYTAAVASLLTLTAFSYSVQSSLPKLPYLTWSDRYFLFGFLVHFIIVFKVTIASQVCLDTKDNRSITMGDTVCQERNHWSTIVIAIVWVTSHALMLISTKLPNIVANRVRVPFKTLIKQYADNFFSDPVLCTMSETMETLNRTDKHSMEMDVFQNKEYRKHVEKENEKEDQINKLADEKKKADQAEIEDMSLPRASSK